jgi:hypothetical protein
MNVDQSRQADLPRWVNAAVWIFALSFPLWAISTQSLWIDEAITGNAVRQPTLHACWASLLSVRGSDLQMPLYMAYVWAWEKIFGGSEIALRLANYPWFVAAQIAGSFFWPDRRKGLLFIAIAGSNAFLWFYLNEARPYMMEYGAACAIVFILCSLTRSDISTSKWWILAAAVVMLAGANMLGFAWAGTTLLVVTFLLVRRRRRPPIFPTVCCFVLLTILAGYYAWTLSIGARAAALPVRLPLNAIYLLYELSGFAGLGPGRIEIRTHGLTTFRPYMLPLVAFALAWVFVFIRSIKRAFAKDERDVTLAILAYAIPPLLFLLVLGVVSHFNVLARHATPSLPLLLILCTLGVYDLAQDRHLRHKAIAAGFGVFAIVSCLCLRFMPRHAKDDYRAAAAAAFPSLTNDSVVWWCANTAGAEYYYLPTTRHGEIRKGSALNVVNPDEAEIERLPRPNMVVLSKADLYDSHGAIAAMLKKQSFVQVQTLQAFSIWRKP